MPITLRLADPADADALRRLAERDSAALPPGPHLIAVRDGELEAAISLASGEILADPFRHTADVCALLRCAARRRPSHSRAPGLRRAAPVLRERLA
jgi:hypothetical protein